MANVKDRRLGATTIGSKHQITIPAAELRAAGLEAGERLVARADGPGRVILEREHDLLADFTGALTGIYADHGPDILRDEWDWIHLDTGVVIGLLDADGAHHQISTQALAAAPQSGDRLARAASAFAECLVGPSRRGDRAMATAQDLFERLPIDVIAQSATDCRLRR